MTRRETTPNNSPAAHTFQATLPLDHRRMQLQLMASLPPPSPSPRPAFDPLPARGLNGHGHGSGDSSSPRCTGCGTSNAPERRFCSSCGAALWAPCIACGELCSTGERFCGGCGANLAEALQARLNHWETQELYARSLQMTHRYAEALSALEPLRSEKHPRLAEPAARIEELCAEIRGEAAAWELREPQDAAAARTALARRDYDEAVRLLEGLPERLRGEETRRLYEEASAKQREYTRLAAEIRAAVSARALAGLLIKVERFLELKPDDTQAADLRERLLALEQTDGERRRDALTEAAQRKLAGFQYDEAVKHLEQIAPAARTAESEKILEFAREVAFLNRGLRTALVLDEHLLPLAERLGKLRPQDPWPAQLAEQLREANGKPPGELVAAIQSRQAKYAAESVFAMPLSVLRGARRLTIDPAVAASPDFARHDANLGIAWGLALQGLGLAAVDINLRPSATGIRKLLAGVRKKPARAAWGLDLGQFSLKAVRLSLAADDRPVCDAVECMEYPSPFDSESPGPQAALRALVERRRDLEEATICLGLPGQDLFTRFFRTPPLDRKKLDSLVQYEAKNQIPFDLNLFSWDYHEFAQAEAERDFGEFEIGVFAVRLVQLEKRLALLDEAGLKPHCVQANGVALHNFLRYEAAAGDSGKRLPTATEDAGGLSVALDLGSETSNFVVSGPEFLWLRNVQVGGNALTKAISRELKITLGQAETMKRQPAAARLHRVHQACGPALDELVTQVQHSLRCFSNIYPDKPLRRMHLHGDGVRLHGLLCRLRAG